MLQLIVPSENRFYNPCMLKIRNVFHADEKAYMAVHLRVEDDWVGACLIKEAKLAKAGNDPSKKAAQIRKGNAGRSCFGAGQIAEIILNTKGLAQQYRNILLLYAADKSDFTSKIRPKQMRVDPVKVVHLLVILFYCWSCVLFCTIKLPSGNASGNVC